MNNSNISVRKWLKENNYDDIARLIDELMIEWKSKGKHTRRNWWDVLAGGKDGKPCTIDGRVFPVLRAAQIRKGIIVTKNAICRNEDEKFPFIKESGRWPKNKNGMNNF